MPDLRMSWFCSFVCHHWQELMEWNSGCEAGDHAIATLLLRLLDSLKSHIFQLLSSWICNTNNNLLKIAFLCVTDYLDHVHDIHSSCLSGVLESLQHCCKDFSAAGLTLLAAGRNRRVLPWGVGSGFSLAGKILSSVTYPFFLWIPWYGLSWGTLLFYRFQYSPVYRRILVLVIILSQCLHFAEEPKHKLGF